MNGRDDQAYSKKMYSVYLNRVFVTVFKELRKYVTEQ